MPTSLKIFFTVAAIAFLGLFLLASASHRPGTWQTRALHRARFLSNPDGTFRPWYRFAVVVCGAIFIGLVWWLG